MGFLALLLLLLFLFFGASIESDEGPQSQVCAVAEGGKQHCAPTLIGEEFQLPASGTVIHAVVNNGPLPPEYQQGYEITIDASGLATVVVTPEGASETLGDQRTADPITTTVDLGIDGLQQLLRDLNSANFFFLPTTDEIDPADVPVGGGASYIEVTLADGTWDVSGPGLPSDESARLDAAQALLAAAVGLDPDDPIGSATPATPVAR